MAKFSVKFFGAKQEKQQIKMVKMEVEAEDRSKVKDALSKHYKVINGLKIH